MFMLLLCLIIVLGIVVVWRFEVARPLTTLATAVPVPEETPPEPVMQREGRYHPVFEQREEIVPSPFIVKHLNDGMATLMMRHRASKNACTASLIIWSGKKKRQIRDSYYDLGMRTADGIGEEIIEEFVQMAKQKLDELKPQGRKKRMKKTAGEVEKSTAPESPTEAGTDSSTVAIEANEKPGPAIKIKKFPSVYRGRILEAGIMPRAIGNETIEMYGVRYRTAEGVEDVVWGTGLKTELRDAHAGVGDDVEILKIGRKTVGEGKAPMNLYKVCKLAPEQAEA
ncbi:MAG: hypothetical protein LC131_03610 [Anaerolineae bacterium]|nr:hypothetical protein [Anaerolineae bacterium]